jgi:putative PIN family toxin of toxin-antitoxin system
VSRGASSKPKILHLQISDSSVAKLSRKYFARGFLPPSCVPRLIATRRLVALATPPLFLEYEDVLKRPEHRLAHGLAPEAMEEFLAELAALIEPVEVHFQWRPQSRDPNDEMVLEAAINGRADALVT